MSQLTLGRQAGRSHLLWVIQSDNAKVLLAAAGVLLLLSHRNYALFLQPEFWAEDITVYFVQDRSLGLGAIFLPHNGFIQLLCRVFAWICGFAPPIMAPRLYASFFILTIAATAALAYTSPAFKGWAKPLAALALLAAPVNSEVFFGMCYALWVLGPVAGLALYEHNPSRSRAIALASAFAVIGLSSPFVLIAAPFAAWKALRERTVFAYSLVGLTVASGFFHLQNIFARFAEGSTGGSWQIKLDSFSSIFYRWLTGSSHPGFAIALAISCASIACVALYFWANKKIAVRPVLYLYCYAILLLAVSCAGIDTTIEAADQFGYSARYFYIPVVFLLWTFLTIDQEFDRRKYTLPIFASVIACLYLGHVRGSGDQFKDTHWPATAKCLEAEAACTSPLNPTFLGSMMVPTNQQMRLRP